MTKPNLNGAILYEGPSAIDGQPIVVIMTGIKVKSKNEKTGNMLQTWIIRSDIHPADAINTGSDYSICGNCPHRKHSSPSKIRTCYVNMNTVYQVYHAYREGKYLPLNEHPTALKVIREKPIRLGAYGDPVNIPLHVIHRLSTITPGMTGYTHQWSHPRFSSYKRYCVASVDNMIQFLNAEQLGWSTFFPYQQGTELHKKQVSCQGGVKTTCSKCLLCAGSSDRQKHITVPVHGSQKKHIITQ